MSISDEKTISVTTYKRSGDAVATPTWVVALDGNRVGFWTSSKSGKAKRLRNNARVVLQPSTQRGKLKPGTEPVEGTAELTSSGADYEAIQAKIRAKYGVMVPVSRLFNTLGHLGKGAHPYGDVVVTVTLQQE